MGILLPIVQCVILSKQVTSQTDYNNDWQKRTKRMYGFNVKLLKFQLFVVSSWYSSPISAIYPEIVAFLPIL